MSKSTQPKEPWTRFQPSGETTRAKTLRSSLFYLIAAIVIAVPFACGKYLEFNSPGAFDSGGYIYSAQSILQGAKLGVSHKPSAQTGTLLVNMLGVGLFGFNETGPKMLQTVFQLTALLMMFFAVFILYGKGAAAVSVFVASFYLSAPLIAKTGNVKEQFMIACMIIGVSCFIFRQLNGRWWWAVLAGVFLACGPLFKQTGTSALAAVGLFLLLGPVFKWRSWSFAGREIGLLFLGFLFVVAPIALWLLSQGVSVRYWPYWSVFEVFFPVSDERLPSYVTEAHKLVTTSELSSRVFRYYRLLVLPICLALGSGVLALVFSVFRLKGHSSSRWSTGVQLVLVFFVWWLLDMAYVWISPRSYEQYFLPLTASGAMCGAFLVAWYLQKLKSSPRRSLSVGGAVAAVVVMVVMALPVAFGTTLSPHSGTIFRNEVGQPTAKRGYLQQFQKVRRLKQDPWLKVSQHIRLNSTPEDTIYVWGWYPGIYVYAGRLSSAPKAFEGTMHTLDPEVLSQRVGEILTAFRRQAPKYIVDSRKLHFPWIRLNLELWPRWNIALTENPLAAMWPGGSPAPELMPRDKRGYVPETAAAAQLDQFDLVYRAYIKRYMQFVESHGGGPRDPLEIERYKALRPFRDYVMKHYVPINGVWEPYHGLFRRKAQ